MVITKFYNLINDELALILSNNSSDERTKVHKEVSLNKGYALLIWFLNFYGQKELYKSFITDGKDDKSCDIIFSNKNTMDEDIFYVVQSKYVNFDGTKKREEEFPQIEKKEFGYALNDFSVILSGQRIAGKNESFNKKYEDLKNHLEKNGKVKFIFFSLANKNNEIDDSIASFNKNYSPNVTLEVIDFERIRRDYIEFKYKEIKTSNPLEYTYNPEDTSIELNIERFKDSKRDVFEFEGREKAFIFLLKPKTIYELFKKYKFSLFFKNVRNPIHKSNYNQRIVDTLLKKPNAFWFFNNGITAITKILPDVGIHAKTILLEGLQIINGAQTVYSVYLAYEKATNIERKAMDNYAKIAFRLIGSSDEEFNLQITRYTNMQNPMHNRDFWANDDVQQRLQNESFCTNLWYEKRRDEFQLNEESKEKLNIQIIENIQFALAYASFYLQKPVYSVMRVNDFFVSRKDDKDGLYEEIFNEKTRFEDMYASVYVLNTLIKTVISDDEEDDDKDDDMEDKMMIPEPIMDMMMPMVAISKIIMQKYFSQTKPNKNGKDFNVSLHILSVSKTEKQEEIDELKKILKYSSELIFERLKHEDSDKSNERFKKLMTNPVFYDTISDEIQENGIDIDKIKSINLNESEEREEE